MYVSHGLWIYGAKNDSEDNLRAALGRMGLSSRGMEGVMDQVRNKHYQVIHLCISN